MTTVLLWHVWSAHALTSMFFSEFVLPHVENNNTHNITFDYS